MEHLDKSTARSKAAKLDLQHDFDHPILRDIRFGFRLTDRDSVNQNTNPSYNWQGITQTWMLGWRIADLAYIGDPRFDNKATTLNPFANFFNGKTSVPGTVLPNDALVRGYPDSYASLHKFQEIRCAELKAQPGNSWVTCPTWQPAAYGNNAASINKQTEKTKSFYTQLRFGFDDWAYPVDGNVGIRYVKTDGTAAGYTVFKSSLPNFSQAPNVTGLPVPNIAPFEANQRYSNAYNNVLPSLNLRVKLRSDLQVRLALGKAVSRPEFDKLQGYTNLTQSATTVTDPVTKIIDVRSNNLFGDSPGNPMLKPIRANQMDLTTEWYFGRSSSVTAAVFYKDLKDVIVNQVQNFALNDVNGKPHNFIVTSPVNGAKAKVRGFELAHQQFYSSLPSWLKGFGTQTSYTYVDSKRTLYNSVFTPYCSNDDATNQNIRLNGCDTNGRSFGNLPLQGVARHTFNLALMYDSGPISARVAYNWRSKVFLGQNFAGLPRGNDGVDSNPNSPTFNARNLNWALPAWSDPYGQVDASVFYKVTDKLTVGLEATNLTDAIFRQSNSQQFGNPGASWFVTGPRYTAQARYSF